MAVKKIKLGNLIKTKRADGSTFLSIGLGSKGKNSQYDQSVTVTVRNADGKVVAEQTDGFIDVVDPRTEPAGLLAAGVISEEMAEKMTQNLATLPDKIRYHLKIKAS